jgi:hypothetical protein
MLWMDAEGMEVTAGSPTFHTKEPPITLVPSGDIPVGVALSGMIVNDWAFAANVSKVNKNIGIDFIILKFNNLIIQ